MATIIINDDTVVKGNLTINMRKVIDENGAEELLCEGILRTHLYFEEINALEIPRMKIMGVDVKSETIGSDDYMVNYEFTFSDHDFNGEYIKEGGYYHFLTGGEMQAIENEMFKDDHPFLGSIGQEYKDMYEKDGDSGE